MLLSAATAYYAIFSLFPLLLVLTSLLGFVLHFSADARNAQEVLLAGLAETFSQQFADYIASILRGVQLQAGVGGPIGLVTLLFGAIGMFTQVDAAFHRIWRVPVEHERWFDPLNFLLLRRARGLLLLVVTGGLVIASYLSQPILASIRAVAIQTPFAQGTTWAAQITLFTSLNVLVLTFIYKVLPKGKVRWREALLGALLTTLLWNAVRVLLTMILSRSQYSAYGLFGAVIVVMLWFYIASAIFYLGAEYIAIISGVDTPGPNSKCRVST